MNFLGVISAGWKSSGTPRPPTLLMIPAVFVAIASFLPVAYLIARSAEAGSGLPDIVLQSNMLPVFTRTFMLIILVTFFSLLVAIPVAWITVKTDIPLRRALSVASVLPLVIPSFVMATTVIEMYSPKGILQGWLSVFGLSRLSDIYGLTGATLVLVLMTYPYALLMIRGTLRRMDPSLEEAARSMGYGAFRTFFTVTLPLIRPAIAAGSLLIALYTLSDFGGVALLRYQTFTTTIMIQYESSLDRTVAAVLSLVLVAFAVLLLLGEGFIRGSGAYHRSTVGAVRRSRRIDLGRWRWI